jgi:hypothetical protein
VTGPGRTDKLGPMRVHYLGGLAVVAAMAAAPLACVDGTTPDCSGTVQCGYPPPPPIPDGGAADGDAASNDGGSDASQTDSSSDSPTESATDAPAG